MEETNTTTTGAAIIVRFAQAVYVLNSNYSQYRCILSECKVTDLTRMTEEQKIQITNQIQLLRKSIHECYILYSGLSRVTKAINKDLEKNYISVDKEFIIKKELAEIIVIELNSFLVENTVRRLLETSEDLIEQVFNKND